MTGAPEEKVKPKLRGVFHFLAFFAAAGGTLLLALAPVEGPQHTAGVIFGASLCLVLGASALYHRPTWSHAMRRRLRRVDHAGIFCLIAGTFTPLAVVQARGAVSAQLIGMWVGAGLGMAFTLLWTDAPRGLRTAVYVLLGAASAPVVLSLPSRIGWGSVALVLLGAFLYLVGGVVYALRRPNPWPRVLGYHELFHGLVVLAAGAHFTVVARLQGLLSP